MSLFTAISILVAHIAFLIQGYQGQNVNADQGVNSHTIFSFDSVNAKVKWLATLGGAHTTEVRLCVLHPHGDGILKFQSGGTSGMESLERLDDKYCRSVRGNVMNLLSLPSFAYRSMRHL